MRTRPPKAKRHPFAGYGVSEYATAEWAHHLSESPRGPDLTWADVESVLAELRALPPALPATPPPMVMAPQTFVALTTAPPPLALNLNVSAKVPTLETM